MKNRKTGEPIVIKLNLSLTLIKTILIITIISLITAQVTLTIIQTQKQKKLSVNQESTENVTYVASKKIDENREEILDDEGNPINDTRTVPVPAGYTASQVPGERSIDTGFVIYEGEINWSDYIVDETAFLSEYNIGENSENDITETDNTINNDTNINENNNTTEIEEINANEINSEEKQERTTNNMTQEGIENETDALKNETTNTMVQESSIQEVAANQEIQNHTTEIAKIENQTGEKDIKQTDDTQLENIKLKEDKTSTSIETTSMGISTYANEITQTDINIFNLQKSVNQYVWVPINEYELEEIYGVDNNGKLWGKLYESYNPTTTHSTSGLNWKLLEDRTMHIIDPTAAREPDVTRINGDSTYKYDLDSQLSKELSGETRYELLSKELEQDFYKTIKSIKKYGGFYIGRYETGGTGTVRKMDYDSNANTWYGLYEKCKALKRENNNVRTSMIWGSLWDATLKWFIASGEKAPNGAKITNDYLTNNTYSIYLGNYVNATFYYIEKNAIEPLYNQNKPVNRGMQVATGSTEHTNINNIYDMAGNEYDYTLESRRVESRSLRGDQYTTVLFPSYRNRIPSI